MHLGQAKGGTMNWARLSRREKMLGVAAAGSLAAILLIHFGWGFALNRIDMLEKETIRLKKEIATSEAYLRREGGKQDEYAKLLDGFTEKSADQDLMAQLLAAIQDEAKTRKINVQELNSLPFSNEDGWRCLRIKLTAGGSWPDLLDFF